MYRLTASYRHPADPDAFLRHYRAVHDPLTRSMPGLDAFEWGICETPDGSTPPFFVVAVLTFADREAAFASLGSEAGQRGAADMANFAMAGVEVTQWEAQTS